MCSALQSYIPVITEPSDRADSGGWQRSAVAIIQQHNLRPAPGQAALCRLPECRARRSRDAPQPWHQTHGAERSGFYQAYCNSLEVTQNFTFWRLPWPGTHGYNILELIDIIDKILMDAKCLFTQVRDVSNKNIILFVLLRN